MSKEQRLLLNQQEAGNSLNVKEEPDNDIVPHKEIKVENDFGFTAEANFHSNDVKKEEIGEFRDITEKSDDLTNFESKLLVVENNAVDVKQEGISNNQSCSFKKYLCQRVPYKVANKIKNKSKLRVKSKIYKCDMCKFKAKRKGDVRIHIKVHKGEKPFSCNICNYTTMYKNKFQIHMTNHKQDQIFTCNLCNFNTVHKTLLLRHMRIHPANNVRRKMYNCNLCGYSTGRQGFLRNHLLWHEEKQFSCNVCGYRTTDKNDLGNHCRIHTSLISNIRSRFSKIVKNST